jgi:hypothetical protein
MAVDDHIRGVSAAPSGVAETVTESEFAYCKDGFTTSGRDASSDAKIETLEGFGALEVVHMKGENTVKTLPGEQSADGHCSDVRLDCGAMHPDMLPERASQSHLSASATPDKAMQFDNITQRILNLHEHLKKCNVS